MRHILDTADHYIISLHTYADPDQHHSAFSSYHGSSVSTLGVIARYNISSFHAYHAHLNESALSWLSSHPDVLAVEPDALWHAAGLITQYNAPTWSLGQLSSRGMTSQGLYYYDSSAGDGAYAYILDSGIYTSHRDLEGRARKGSTVIAGVWPRDDTGHGTAVAGIIGGKLYGVAKKVKMVGVKVMENNMSKTSWILAGYQWAITDIGRWNRAHKSVVTISLTAGEKVTAFDRAVEAAAQRNVVTIGAAGNEGRDARDFAPGSASAAIIVASTDRQRRRAADTNGGPGVAIFAPGQDVRTIGIGDPSARAGVSGTSYAAAHVAGLICYLKMLNPRQTVTADGTKQLLLRLATVQGVGRSGDAPNRFVYNGSGK